MNIYKMKNIQHEDKKLIKISFFSVLKNNFIICTIINIININNPKRYKLDIPNMEYS